MTDTADLAEYLAIMANYESVPLVAHDCVQLRKAAVRLAALHEALRDFGRHAEGCSAAFGTTYRCRCGWREVAQTLIP